MFYAVVFLFVACVQLFNPLRYSTCLQIGSDSGIIYYESSLVINCEITEVGNIGYVGWQNSKDNMVFTDMLLVFESVCLIAINKVDGAVTCNTTHKIYSAEIPLGNNVESKQWWRCIANVESITTVSMAAQVRTVVHVQLVSINRKTVIDLDEETSIDVECESMPYSRPRTEITWYMTGIGDIMSGLGTPVYTSDSLDPTLTTTKRRLIYTGKRGDNGESLYCAGRQLLRSVTSQNITLYIKYPPATTLVLTVIPSSRLLVGSSVNVTCSINGGNPLATLNLLCSSLTGSSFDTATTAITMLVFTVNASNNGNQCECTATHPVNDFRETLSKTIEVQYAPFELPVITQSFPQTDFIYADTNVTLSCDVSGGNPPAVLSWDCDRNIAVTNNTSINKASYSVTIRVSKHDNGRICTCSATHPVQSYRPYVQYKLKVYYPPNAELVITQSPLRPLDTGEEVTLTCKVTGGNPLAELNWNCGQVIENNTSGNTSSYSVRFQVNRSYNGKQCNCSATHPVPTYRPTNQHILIVYYAPSVPSLTMNPNLPLFEGNSTDITCHVTDAGNPQSHFTWTWNDTILHTSLQNVFEIGPVDKNDNGAVVSCRVENKYSNKNGIDLQVKTSLNIEYNPIVILEEKIHTVVEGQPVNIKCITFGNPTPHASWIKMEERHVIVEGSQDLNLTIPEINRHKEGRYKCEAVSKSIAYGVLMNSAYIDLIVYYPPNVSIEYTLNGNNEGQSTYQCNGEGNPNTMVYTGWTQAYNGIVIRNSEKLKEFTQDNNKKLILSQLTYQDSGNYTCFVNNGIPDRLGEVTQYSKVQLEIKVSPELLDELPPDDTYSTERGGQIAISLRFITFPDIYVAFWYRNTSKLSIKTKTQDGIEADIEKTTTEANFHDVVVNVSNFAYLAHLKISNLEEHMEGAYILVLRNGFKDKNITVFVVISSKPDDPSDLNITRTTSSGMTISWKRGYSGGHYQCFNVSVFDSTGIRFTALINDNYTVTTQIYTITDLNPSTEYVLQLFSLNEIGQSNVIKINSTLGAADAGSESTNQDVPVATVVGLLTGVLAAVLVAIVIVYMKRRCSLFGKGFKKSYTNSSKSDDYSDLQTCNPAFQDPYTSLQNFIESSHHQESNANTYEECGNASDAAAYQNIENMKSGHKQTEKKMCIYENMKI